VGVALGAFGAHALKERLGANHTVWETAVQYQFLHAVGLLFLGLAGPYLPAVAINRIGLLFLVGVVLFSGSLYVLALTDIKILGAVTPLGGLCFLAGWIYLSLVASTGPKSTT
jgi:uncharacterized membrane protein YgdD (TMEM256/DUF423 family)